MRTPRPPSSPPDTPNPGVPARNTTLPDTPTEPIASKPDLSMLGQIEHAAITLLTVTIPSTVLYPHRPMTPLVMLDFREPLVRGKLPQERKDAAWRHLAGLARTERGEWNLYALGTAHPLLRSQANKLRDPLSGADKRERHLAIAREFLFALHRLDLSGAYVFNRLVDAAYTHASGRKRRPRTWIDLDTAVNGHAPAAAGDLADSVLNTLVTPRELLEELITKVNAAPGRQRITDVQAALLIRTYLDGERLRDVAAAYGLSEPSASKQRRRAASTIARLMGRPDLAEQARNARS
ncbi:hypothetical protein AB0M46_19745 [Dactylosporangium sp. NPDC051485]|uniref:hypothetical protein n=1 Tax=Dactylosporangium sp. NPDC051485 TaxID=3154846 RepID=UPI00341C053D